MALTADQITAKNFKEFYDRIYPYLNGAAHAGFTPIGTVISYMGTTAPQNYLACDDTAYNIADYPELAAFFEAQFGAVNYFGGDGTTTFKCPDLRGEFLRGTGTNGHTEQGNGANVGVHQDGTEIPNIAPVAAGTSLNARKANTTGSVSVNNMDAEMNATKNLAKATSTYQSAGSSSAVGETYTTRPTNTSVLYCIAYKDIYVDARYDYRTTEKIVGTWIDGKPIYQKTYLNIANDAATDHNITIDSTITKTTHTLIGGEAVKRVGTSSDLAEYVAPYGVGTDAYATIGITNSALLLRVKASVGTKFDVTVRYTKATD